MGQPGAGQQHVCYFTSRSSWHVGGQVCPELADTFVGDHDMLNNSTPLQALPSPPLPHLHCLLIDV
jgi:hypothetical protein